MTSPHSTLLYVPSGKGILYAAEWNGDTPPTYPGATNYPGSSDMSGDLADFEDLGNCPSMEVEPTVEYNPHYSSREGLRQKDLNPIISSEYTANFDLDEVSAGNMSKFLMGSINSAARRVSILQGSNKEYALIFISNNNTGPNYNLYLRRVSLGPNGPAQFISDGEYLTMSYTATGVADSTNYSSSPFGDMKFITTTTTSTSTTTTTTA